MEISKRYNSVPVKDNCALFAPTPYFRAQAIRWCHLNFSPADPCCNGNEFWDKINKIDYNLAPVKDYCALFAPTPTYTQVLDYNSVAMRQIPRSTERISSSKYFYFRLSTRLIVKSKSLTRLP